MHINLTLTHPHLLAPAPAEDQWQRLATPVRMNFILTHPHLLAPTPTEIQWQRLATPVHIVRKEQRDRLDAITARRETLEQEMAERQVRWKEGEKKRQERETTQAVSSTTHIDEGIDCLGAHQAQAPHRLLCYALKVGTLFCAATATHLALQQERGLPLPAQRVPPCLRVLGAGSQGGGGGECA